jgi:outer membrane autotransporter protein
VRFNLANGQNYTTADSTVFSYGGGLDVDVFRQYQLKLDMQQQYWLLGDQPFKPWIATVGVTYRFHFRDYIH